MDLQSPVVLRRNGIDALDAEDAAAVAAAPARRNEALPARRSRCLARCAVEPGGRRGKVRAEELLYVGAASRQVGDGPRERERARAVRAARGHVLPGPSPLRAA